MEWPSFGTLVLSQIEPCVLFPPILSSCYFMRVDATTKQRLELLKKAIDVAYETGYRNARNELLDALKNHKLRAVILKALADESLGEKS